MSRVEAAAEALEERAENDDWEWCLGDAQAALAAADAYDAAHGIHRVVLDDATVERAQAALIDALTNDDTGIGSPWVDADYPDDAVIDGRFNLERITRAVLAAAVKEER